MSKLIDALNRVQSLKDEDPEKVWNAISYYILMNHKNIQQFCKDYSETGFNIK